jgi:hypothetical protein
MPAMRLPAPRGPLTDALVTALRRPRHEADVVVTRAAEIADGTVDPLADEDLQLALTVLYELHYRGFDEVDERWEWSPTLLTARAVLEERFEREVRERFTPQGPFPRTAREVAATLFELTAETGGPSLSGFVAREADVHQVHEMLVLRSGYQLKEADPHTWAIPRFGGATKAALVEIQADEYGGGRPERVHAEMFAASMRAVGLDDRYGAYLDHLPALTLASANVMSLFGLHRRLRGALVGHLAAYEMTSSAPCKRYAAGLRRLGLGDEAAAFFDEHVEADAVHEQLAAHDLCGSLVAAEPELAGDVLLGAATCLGLDELAGAAVLQAFAAGRSALRLPLPPVARLHSAGRDAVA